MEKYYYKVVETSTGKVLKNYFERPDPDDEYNGDSIRVPYSVLEKGVQLVKRVVNQWSDVATLQDAIFKLGGPANDLVCEYYNAKHWFEKDPSMMALLQLRIIVAAINEGWEPSSAVDAQKWYAVYDGEVCKAVLGGSVPKQLAVENAKKAQFICDNFSDLLVDYFYPATVKDDVEE